MIERQGNRKLIFPEDIVIIKGCIEREPFYQKALYDKYCRELFTTAFYIIHDYDLSNDVLHDAYIKIYQDISTLKKFCALKAWMNKIVVNISIQTIKRYRRIKYTEIEKTEKLITWPEPLSGEELEKAIFSLADGYRIVFSLIEIEGYKHSEVADMLNISVGTSKSQLYHAKKQLRMILGNLK